MAWTFRRLPSVEYIAHAATVQCMWEYCVTSKTLTNVPQYTQFTFSVYSHFDVAILDTSALVTDLMCMWNDLWFAVYGEVDSDIFSHILVGKYNMSLMEILNQCDIADVCLHEIVQLPRGNHL